MCLRQDLHTQYFEQTHREEAVAVVVSYDGYASSWPPGESSPPSSVGYYRLNDGGLTELRDCQDGNVYSRSLADPNIFHNHTDGLCDDVASAGIEFVGSSVTVKDFRPQAQPVPAGVTQRLHEGEGAAAGVRAPSLQVTPQGLPLPPAAGSAGGGSRSAERSVPPPVVGSVPSPQVGRAEPPSAAPPFSRGGVPRSPLPWVKGACNICDLEVPPVSRPAGLAVSLASEALAMSCYASNRVFVFHIRKVVGGSSPFSLTRWCEIGSGAHAVHHRQPDDLLFASRSSEFGCACGALAFTAPAHDEAGRVRSTLLVVEGGHERVQERALDGTFLRFLYAPGSLEGAPRGTGGSHAPRLFAEGSLLAGGVSSSEGDPKEPELAPVGGAAPEAPQPPKAFLKK